jgi:predicted lactoylglutathione lyase
MPPHLSMVVLSARDLPALRRFYGGLGWPERPGASDALAMFDLGTTVLTLHRAPPVAGGLSPTEAAGSSAVTLVVGVDRREAVDEAVAAALALGALQVSEPADQSFGGRSAVVADPEGNRWEVLWVSRGQQG